MDAVELTPAAITYERTLPVHAPSGRTVLTGRTGLARSTSGVLRAYLNDRANAYSVAAVAGTSDEASPAADGGDGGRDKEVTAAKAPKPAKAVEPTELVPDDAVLSAATDADVDAEAVLAKAVTSTAQLLTRCNTVLTSADRDTPQLVDLLAVALLCRGAALSRASRSPTDAAMEAAVQCFQWVVDHAKTIKRDLYTVPYALYELGVVSCRKMRADSADDAEGGGVERAAQQAKDALALYKRARDTKGDYNFKYRLHLRVHLGMDDARRKLHELDTTT